MTDLHGGYRPRPEQLALKRGAVDFSDDAGVAAIMKLVGDAELPPVAETAAEPFVGITTDGQPLTDLFTLADEGAPTERAVREALGYLGRLTAAQQALGVLPVDATEWRLWSNAFLTFPEHGLLLQELPGPVRESALSVIEATISPEGYELLRQAMRLNAELGELVGRYPDTLTEYCYRFTLFGEPSLEQPWGWQLAGHHIDLHALFIGGQLVLTPTFLGVEFGGEAVFADQRERAREFMESLSAPQRDRALLYGSMLSADLPPELSGIVDGRHRTAAGRDNRVLPYVGLAGDRLTPGQRELLLSLTDPYLEALPPQPRAHRRNQIERFLDDTHLGWIGTWEPGAPFYYRVHSPVVLIEYDNHAGIFLDNDEPEPYHVHTIVRTPNGGDYGKDLLRQHYAHQHPHT
ncbi:DUF3500 domain-containing protein [Streptomyces sp. A012304]|uniref:DUF3500 domain-containing protein n=1 Tax=Streptomyces sp. A012304 TaxID=375446 RepID=UPI00222EF891|nr:DUF3500 domain-containing protein [Streptomyces sp. A012304]GKQ39154.1 hypothetical protein ALMP_56830 [Streptomyces sp. A012304]